MKRLTRAIPKEYCATAESIACEHGHTLADVDWLIRFINQSPTGRLKRSLAARERTLIVWGETDGLRGMSNVLEVFNEFSKNRLLISGGVFDRSYTTDDIDARNMKQALCDYFDVRGINTTPLRERIAVDPGCTNTREQMTTILRLIERYQIDSLVLIEPLYHMPRFICTLGYALQEVAMQVPIVPFSYGNWETLHSAKGDLNYNSFSPATYAELFFNDPRVMREPGKMDGGELRKIFEYANPTRNVGAHTLMPRETLAFFNDNVVMPA